MLMLCRRKSYGGSGQILGRARQSQPAAVSGAALSCRGLSESLLISDGVDMDLEYGYKGSADVGR
jgi:hypothetical protein